MTLASTNTWALLLMLAALPGVATAHGHAATSSARSITSVDVYVRGDTVDLLTAETQSGEATLWHRRSSDGGRAWSAPTRVDAKLPAARRPHRGNDVQIASNTRHIIAAWTSAGRGWLGSGPLITAFSADGGKTWQRGGSPAYDERADGQSYADLSARGDRFHLTWLDSRGSVQGVRYAMSSDGGATWKANVSIKNASCECCWNAILPTATSSVYLLYRDKTPRDMAVAVSHDDGITWKNGGIVGAFNWRIDACPHTGGALAQTRSGTAQRLHALVWTGKPEARGLHVFSTRSELEWNAGTRVGGEYAQRGDLAGRGDELIAVWEEPVNQRGAVFYARSRNAGGTWSKPERLSSDELSAAYPRVVMGHSTALVLWTEALAGGESKLRMMLLK